MDRATALDALPVPYGLALRLAEAGHDRAEIAEQVGVPVDAIGALLEVGAAKLDALLASELGV